MSGRTITAAEAKAWGLITEVVPATDLGRATMDADPSGRALQN